MTRERAKRIAAEWSFGGVCTLREGEAAEYHKLFYELLCQQERNDPLTLEELRKMDEEPVWIKADHYGVYADIVHIIGREEGRLVVSFKVNYRLQENGYGKTWMAYRRKQEEDKHEAD